MEFFLRPAGGRLGPVADSGLVLPVGECHEVYGERTGRAGQNFLRRRRQLVKLVRALASQEMDGRCTTMRLFFLNCFIYSKTSALALNQFRPDTTA